MPTMKLWNNSYGKLRLPSISDFDPYGKQRHLLYGRRAQYMFGYIVSALRKCRLVKQEDSGFYWMPGNQVRIPDFRVIIDSGEVMLIEVKNFYTKRHNRPFTLKQEYVNSLLEYSNMMEEKLMFAVYWAVQRFWVLLNLDSFLQDGQSLQIDLLRALARNQMHLLGDRTLGTTPPLVLRFIADPEKPRSISESGEAKFTIGGVKILADGKELQNDFDQALAFFMMVCSDWEEGGPYANLNDSILESIDYVFEKERSDGQNFAMCGPLSRMLTVRYDMMTVDDSGKVVRMMPSVGPADLGATPPERYRGELPLWQFTIHPMTD